MNLVLDNLIYSLQTYGGISVYWNELTQRLRRDHISFESHSYPSRPLNHTPIHPDEIHHKNPIVFERLRGFTHGPSTPHLFHSSYYRHSTSKQATTILTVHDLIFEKMGSWYTRTVKTYPKRKSIEQADFILCVSENTRQDLLNTYGIKEEKTKVVYNGASTQFFRFPADTIRTLEKKWLVFIGDRWFYKRFHLFAKLFHHLDQSYIPVIVGGAPLNNMERRLFGSHVPHHLTGLSTEDLNLVYNQAYALIYPSAYEGFGIPFVEAARAGCPILCFNHSCIPEILGDTHPLFIEGNSELDCLVSMKALLAQLDESPFRSKVIHHQETSTQKFTWEKTYQETLSVYKQMS